MPGEPTILCFPDAAADGPEIVGVRLARHARDGDRAAAAKGADEAPFHAAVSLGIDLLSMNDETSGDDEKTGRDKIFDGLAQRFHTNLRALNGTLHGITGGTGNYRQ